LIANEGTEGGGVNGRMMADVVSEFSGGKVVGPIILMDSAVSTKILLKFLINTFSLTISLRMISHAHGLLNVEEFTEFSGGGSELRTAI